MTRSNRLRVLFLASYFPKPDNPFMGTWALSEAQALVRQNVELLVVSCTSWVPKLAAKTDGAKAYSDCPQEFVWPGPVRVLYPRWFYYPVNPIKTWSYKNPTTYLHIAWQSVKLKLLQIIVNFQPDFFFCHHLLPNGWILSQLPKAYQRPVISSDHDLHEITDCNHLPYRRSAMSKAIRHCQMSLTVSNRMTQNLRQLFPEQPIYTYHHGVDLPPVAIENSPRPHELRTKKIVLCCALFSVRKAVPLLVEAFCRIAPQHPNAILRIIGDGPDSHRVIEAIQQYDSTSQVQFLGKKHHADVLQEMAWSDCFALISWDEPLGQVYLEAMAAGKPILCCQDAGIMDLIIDSEHGYSVPPRCVTQAAKALHQLLGNDSRREAMGFNARKLIEDKLTWDLRAEKLINIFCEGKV